MTIPEEFRNELIDSLPALKRVGRGLLAKRGLDTNLCDDFVQDTVIKALSSHESFRPGTNMVAWLVTIFKHNVDNQKRKERTKQAWLKMQEEERKQDLQEPDQLEILEYEDIMEIFQTLPKEMKVVLHLVGHQGRSYKEAADILNVSVGTVKSRVSRARQVLAGEIRKREQQAEIRIELSPGI